jgi:hypothetical protein
MEIDIGRLTMERGRPDVSLWHFCCAESTTARPCSSPALLSLEPILIAFIMPEPRVAVQAPAAPMLVWRWS